MSRRAKQKSFIKHGAGPAAELLGLLTLLGLVSLLLRKGILRIDAVAAVLFLCCLISGTAGAAVGARREGRGKRRLLYAVISPLLLLMLGMMLSKGAAIRTAMPLYALGMYLPSLAFCIPKRRRAGKRKTHSPGRPIPMRR
jgi:hypothetical protein